MLINFLPTIEEKGTVIAVWEITIKLRNQKLDLGTSLDIYLGRLKQ